MAGRGARLRRSLTGKRWALRDCDEAARDRLAAKLGLSPVVARVLVNRGLGEAEAARRFLAPELNDLHEPALLPDIDKAVERIRAAVGAGERILIYGDYDADGVTAVSLLVQFLRLVGVEALHYIPNRVAEGYGVHAEAIEAAAGDGVGLIVTVDCGTRAVAEVERACQLGVDVIVTDHHEPGPTVPRAVAVVNPKLTGSLYPFRDLAGVGVAFKLAWALAQTFSPGKRVSAEFRRFLLEAVGLVALGTVADVVPLTGENRVFATYGLDALAQSPNAGIQALIAQASLAGKPLRPVDVAFKLAPRLNAAGRIADGSLCVELLTCESLGHAAAIARELESRNRERRRIQDRILSSARQRLAEDAQWQERRSIVLADESWHAGVVGIVAAKLAEEFHRPTVLLTLADGLARGSARSVPGFDLFEAVEACSEAVVSCGGHRQAAGLTVEGDRLEAFRALFEDEAARRLGQGEPCGVVEIDAELDLGGVGLGLVRELERLAPFGQGNSAPVFVASRVAVAGTPSLMGGQGQHLSFYGRQGHTSLRVVGFGMGHLYEALAAGGVVCDIAFRPKINDFGGIEEVELELCDLRPCQ